MVAGMQARLIPHPATPSAAVARIEVAASRPRRDALLLHYSVAGDMSALRIPEPADPVRTDELWKHTCLEVFLRPAGGTQYFEANLAPSTRWATYAFEDTRVGMRNADELSAPGISCTIRNGRSLELRAAFDLSLAHLDATTWSLGLSAVMEEVSGAKSYWALAHPGERPDFHDPRAFTLDLPPPDAK